MKRALITGMSGAGKSSLLDELAETLAYQRTGSAAARLGHARGGHHDPVGRVADIVLDHVR